MKNIAAAQMRRSVAAPSASILASSAKITAHHTQGSSSLPIGLSSRSARDARLTFEPLRAHSTTGIVGATHVSLQAAPSSVAAPTPRPPVLDFTDTKEAYKSKTTGELLHALVIFNLCTIKPMVQNSEKLLRFARKTFGDKFVEAIVRPTFFRYFCAGEDGESIRPKVSHLRAYNVGGILDYAAEADVAHENNAGGATFASKPSSGASASAAVSTHSRYGAEEKQCDSNVTIFRDCITAVHNVTPEGFAAIKMTALSNPILIERVSSVITELRNVFYADFSSSATTTTAAAAAASANNNNNVDDDGRVVTREQFTEGLKNNFVGFADADIDALFLRMDVDKSGTIDVFEWTCTLSLEELIVLAGKAKPGSRLAKAKLDTDDLAALDRMLARLIQLAELAQQKEVRLMVDAEQTYFQPAIDHLVLELQRKYNRKAPVVWGTYQCYLRDSYRRLSDDLHRAKNEGFMWGAKLVRGAYMSQESQRAEAMGYPNPIWPNIEATHANYNRCLALVLTKLHRANVLVASHNQASAEFATSEMKARGIDPATGGVYFGQLLGMADHLTFTLGQNGFKAYKYVPYGPILEVVPYLIRRAQENSNIMGGVGVEKRLIWKELVRRRFMPQARAPPVRKD